MVNRVTRLFISLFLSILALALLHRFLVFATPSQQVPDISAMSIQNRELEPVILKGVFSGLPGDEIFVYRETGGVWEQIPFQIDEVTTSGSYTSFEDGLMDSNDEIVFMAKDLGDQATTSITMSLPISLTWYEIKVTDPLSPANKVWAYIVRSSTLAPSNAVDYANYDAANKRIIATNYTIGWATNHAGLNYTSLFGSGNYLDRTKLRLRYFFIKEIKLTEDSALLQPPPPLILNKDGPVRVIVSRGSATTFGYASFFRTTTQINLSELPGTLLEVRVSTDLANTAVGTYYNENVPGGVPINGTPDLVPVSLTDAWHQISLNSGATIRIVDLGSLGGTIRHYYKDNSAPDSTDTGDGMSYGDSGVMVTTPSSKQFTIESIQYILPGMQGNRGDEFYNYFQNPLRVSAQVKAPYKVFLPVVQKNN